MNRSAGLVAFAAMLLAGCSDQAPPEVVVPPVADPSVYVAGTVVDPDGAPVPRVTITWWAWPGPDSVQQGVASSFDVRYFGQTDTLGRFARHLAYYSIPQLDSVVFTVATNECWGVSGFESRQRAVPLTPVTPDTVFNSRIVLTRTSARSRLALGPNCAVLVEPPFLSDYGSEDYFGLWFDELTDSIAGRWRINYTASFGDDYGRFSGVRNGNLLTLTLREDVPYGNCTHYTLVLPIETGDTLGTGTYSSVGCHQIQSTLHFHANEGLQPLYPYQPTLRE